MPQAPSHGPLTTNLRAPGAPRERQLPAAGLYSGAMMLPPPYRPATSPATGFGAAIFLQGALRLSSGKNLKMANFGWVLSNFVPQGVPPGHSAPSPIVPAGKLNTAQTMLPSGEGLKKRNIVWILFNSSPVIASPFAPGGALSFPCQLPTAYYLLPPGYTCVAPPLPGLKTRARPQGEGVPQDLYTLIIWKNE